MKLVIYILLAILVIVAWRCFELVLSHRALRHEYDDLVQHAGDENIAE